VTRHRLGDWTCPSGNNVEAWLETRGNRQAEIRLAWDVPPPLNHEDEAFYIALIRPQVIRLAAEYLEEPCRKALVITT
jgi:hypothetical protein